MFTQSFLFKLLRSALLFLALLNGGCIVIGASISTGGLQENREIEAIFESGTLLANYIYYTEGSPKNPEVIIAIDKHFQLKSKLWSQREWTAKDLADTVFWMQTEEMGFCTNYGGKLIAPDGQEVGIWYSRKSLTRIRQPAPGVVEVFPFDYLPSSPCHRQAFMDDL